MEWTKVGKDECSLRMIDFKSSLMAIKCIIYFVFGEMDEGFLYMIVQRILQVQCSRTHTARIFY